MRKIGFWSENEQSKEQKKRNDAIQSRKNGS